MWNIFLISTILVTLQLLVYGDVSHIVGQQGHHNHHHHHHHHPGYGTHKPSIQLELPHGSSHSTSITHNGYPKEKPDNPLQIGSETGGHLQNQYIPPDAVSSGANTGGVIARPDQHHENHHDDHDHHHHHYHGEDGKYNPHDDGRGWDIRKSVPGEPEVDYPTYASAPRTAFTCSGKVPGYYADIEARCQAFRICTTQSTNAYTSFLCPNGTIFNQAVLTCDWWNNVDCAGSESYYYKNNDIGKMPEGSQLMHKVHQMLQMSMNNFQFTEQVKEYYERYPDNQIQSTMSSEQGLYLPPKVQTTTYRPDLISTGIKNTQQISTGYNYQKPTPAFNTGHRPNQVQHTDQHNVGTQFVSSTPISTSFNQIDYSKVPVQPTVYGPPVTNIQIDQTSQVGHNFQQSVTSNDIVSEGPHKVSLISQQVSSTALPPLPPVPSLPAPTLPPLPPVPPVVSTKLPPLPPVPPVEIKPTLQTFVSSTAHTYPTVGTPSVASVTTNSVLQHTGLNLLDKLKNNKPKQPSTITSGSISKDQAIESINQVQKDLESFYKKDQQQTITKTTNFGKDILDIRNNIHNSPTITGRTFGVQKSLTAPTFLNSHDTSGFGGYTSFVPQPTFIPQQQQQNQQSFNFLQPTSTFDGYHYPNQQQPSVHNHNYQQTNSQSGINYEFSKDSAINNYNGHSISFHQNGGQTHSSVNGQNVAYKENTRVEIVPAIGYEITDPVGHSTVQSLLERIHGNRNQHNPVHQHQFSGYPTGQNQFTGYPAAQSQFTDYQQQNPSQSYHQISQYNPSDVRYSSYHGPSSYLVPQKSVLQLPSDSGYYKQ